MSNLGTEVRDRLTRPSPAVAKAVRKAGGVSQERLARELKVHRVTLARWEDGVHEPRGEQSEKWARLVREIQQAIERAGE